MIHFFRGLLIIVCSLSVLGLTAQNFPKLGISYQAVARDDAGNVLIDQSVNLEFKIYSGEVNNDPVFQESFPNIQTDQFGLINLVIGKGDSIFEKIDWGGSAHKVEVLLNGAPIDTVDFTTIPYSQVSRKAADMTLNELVDVNANGASNGSVLSFNGANWSADEINVDDADSDSRNELQQLSLSGNTLSISGITGTGASVNLSQFDIDNFWNKSGTNVYLPSGRVGIGTSSPSRTLDIRGTLDILSSVPQLQGLTSSNTIKYTLSTTTTGGGFYESLGANGNRNFRITTTDGSNGNRPFVALYNSSGSSRVTMFLSDTGEGVVSVFGANGNRNAGLSFLDGSPNNGYVFVSDALGDLKAGMFVDAQGRGVLFKDVNNFRMPHPNKPGKEIWYASIEGPEAGAYERGTGTLVNGKAYIEFSEHFELVANMKTMTVSLTPLNSKTLGLAVVQKQENGFLVEELMDGKGNFEFDWEVKCVRKGYEDYRVIRDASEIQLTEDPVGNNNALEY